MKKLVILTLEYPYGKGESFLADELKFYSRSKIEVVLVPFKTEGSPRNLPPGVSLYKSESEDWRGWLSAFSSIASKGWLWKELVWHWRQLFFNSSRASILFFIKMALIQRNRLVDLTRNGGVQPTETILYSYWLGGLTGGAVLFNQLNDNSFKIISRAHGGDVYAYRYNPEYIPFRRFVFENASYIAVVSQDGTDYLKTNYPANSQKINCHHLGTAEPGFVCHASEDGIFRVVSCSFIVPVKRLHLIAEALEIFQTKYPSVRVSWTHLGGGPQMDDLVTRSAALTKSVKCHFSGTLTPEQIMTFYRTNSVDLFINTSSSEGMPVSIMEALSVEIPVLAVSVGGIKEVVNERCGKLMPVDITPVGIADVLFEYLSQLNSEQRKNAAAQWNELFQAEKNYSAFLNVIQSLISA